MEIKPFKAFRFDPKVVGDAGSCIAPPFDEIGPDMQQQLYEKSKYNIVRITRGKTTPSDNDKDNQYTRAAEYLNHWIKQGALKQDAQESIYAYVQDFQLAGRAFQRLSFIAQARLEEFGQTVRPHEQVFNEPMIDRLNLKRATAAEFGLVFMLYEDQQKIAEKIIEKHVPSTSSGQALSKVEGTATQKPLMDFISSSVVRDAPASAGASLSLRKQGCEKHTQYAVRNTHYEGVRHRLFAITAKADIDAMVKMMSDKSCIIADGHHRYTAGLTYSKQSANPAAKYQTLAFTNICHEGLKLLATHRLVSSLENFNMEKSIASLKKNFEITEFRLCSGSAKLDAKQKLLAQMKAEYNNDKNALGIYGGNNAFYIAVLRDKQAMDSIVPNMSDAWRSLDVTILHKLVLEKLLGLNEKSIAPGENLEYIKDDPYAIDQSISQIDAGGKQILFLMNPVKIQQLKMVTSAGERMPQKSTYFYPKMYSGLVINKL